MFQKYLCSGLIVAGAHLVELDLSDNAFGPNGMIGLTEFLRSSSCYNLHELRLNNNGLGIQGGKVRLHLFVCQIKHIVHSFLSAYVVFSFLASEDLL